MFESLIVVKFDNRPNIQQQYVKGVFDRLNTSSSNDRMVHQILKGNGIGV